MMIHFLPYFVIVITRNSTNLLRMKQFSAFGCEKNSCSNNMVFKTVGEEKRDLFLKYFSFNTNIENDRLICCPFCFNSFTCRIVLVNSCLLKNKKLQARMLTSMLFR
jgi:hypothetical protein